MNKHKHLAEVQMNGLWALRSLCTNEAERKEILKHAGVTAVMAATKQLAGSSNQVHKSACAILRELVAFDGSVNTVEVQAFLREHGGMDP